ncbi:MAG: FecR domain-containing protein [Pseudomonadota bacterium]
MAKSIRYGLMMLLLIALTSDFAVCEEDVEVLVTRGDTMINICKDYLENPDEWRQVASANPLIRNPDRIFPGKKLTFPARLLKGIPSGGKISFLKGSVEILRTETEGWTPLKPDERLVEGYRIRTGENGALDITFEDESSFLIKSNTCLTLVKTRKSGAGSIIGDFFLELGRVITHIRKATGREPRFRIGTPSAVASVRGTDFRISQDAGGNARIEVLAGSVDTKGKHRRVRLDEGEGTLVEKGRDPQKPRDLLSAPSLISPEPLYRRTPLDFRLETVPEAVFHRLALAGDPEMKDVIREETARPGEISQIVDIVDRADGTYYLQTSSVDAMGLEGLPKVTPISVRLNPLPPFVQSPVAGKEYKTVTMEFSWLSVPDAVGYQLQIAADPEFEKVVEERETGPDTAHKTDRLEPGTYYFRILSKAADGYAGVYSDAVQFDLLQPPPAPAAEPPKVTWKEISIQWQNRGPGITYRFQMSCDKDFKELLVDERVNDPQITLQKPKKAGLYYVRVSSVDTEGFEGRYTPPQSFKIKGFPWAVIGGAAVTVGAMVGILVL